MLVVCSLDVQNAVVIALDIAQALARVHSKGVVHQDVHSGNMLQALDNSGWRLTDFGHAEWTHNLDGSSDLQYEPL